MQPRVIRWMILMGLGGLGLHIKNGAAVESFFAHEPRDSQICLDQQQWLTTNWKLKGVMLSSQMRWAFLLNHEQWKVLQVGDALGPNAYLESIELEAVWIKLEGCPSCKLGLSRGPIYP